MPILPDPELLDSSAPTNLSVRIPTIAPPKKRSANSIRRKVSVASFFYELPVGQGKRYMNQGGVSDRVLGGWYASTILSYNSGTPTEVYAHCNGTAGDVLFAGCHFTGAARVNVIPGVTQTNKSSLQSRNHPVLESCCILAPGSFDVWQ